MWVLGEMYLLYIKVASRGRGLLIVRIKGRTATLFRYLFEILDGHLRTGSFRNALVKLTDQIGGVTPATCITFG